MEFRDAALAQLECLHRLAFHLCRDTATADDLVQETYLLAFRSAHTFKQQSGGIRSWMFKILHNAYRLRGRRDQRLVFDDGLIDDREDQSAADLLAPNSRLDDLNWDAVDESLKSAIHKLPDPLRTVFLLFAVEDLKYSEIADVLAIPVGTVMSRLARARQLLTESLPTRLKRSSMKDSSPRIVEDGDRSMSF